MRIFPTARMLRCGDNGHPNGDHAMIDLKSIDDLARKLSEMVPPDLKNARDDLQQHFRATLQSGLSKLELVTREEFDVQRAVLLRTREKLDLLERVVAVLESRIDALTGRSH
jgi:hypothetical protein